MKKLAPLALILATIPAFANITITADEHIVISNINGKVVNQGLFQKPTHSFTLPAGPVSITARYDRLFELGRDDHEFVKSTPITLSTTLNNGNYRLTMPNLPNNYNAIKEYIKSPTLALTDGHTVLVEAQSDGTPSSFLGGLFGKKSTEPTHMTPTNPAQSANTLDSFMQLWLNANENERDKIRHWVNQQ